MSVLGDNIANISTVGFKGGQTTFSSLVTGGSSSGSGGGVNASTRISIDNDGLIQGTGYSTDVAIAGNGFFVVKDDPQDPDSEYVYSRAGSFRQDERGFFVNSSGHTLQAWPMDNEGHLPGEIGNNNTTSNQLLQSLVSVNTRDISGIAFATTKIEMGINLSADEDILTGAGDDAKPPASSINFNAGSDDILARDAGTLDVGDVLNVTLGDGASYDFEYGGFAESDDILVNNIFGAATPAQRFTVDATVGATYLQPDDNFTISTSSAGTVTFTYKEINPSADAGTFNSLNTLAEAIDAVPSLHARVVDNRLFVSPVDAREEMTITDVTGNIAASLGNSSSLFNSTAVTAANRFSTLGGLAQLVNEQDAIISSVENAAHDSTVGINVKDPLQTITFANDGANTGDILSALNLSGTTFNPIYDANGVIGKNMASGDISPAFSRNIRVYDSLGSGHDILVSFVKADENEWLVEIYAADEDEISTTKPNGQLASGTILFNGDGSLRNVSASLTDPIEAIWTNEAVPSNFEIDFGTAGSPAGTEGATVIGLTDGLSQFEGKYSVQYVEQNGASSGLLSSLEIDDQGHVIANFSNGQARKVFKIPLATFPNPNGLTPRSGNVFQQSDNSGEFTLAQAGDSGVGTLSTRALEGSNVELSDELTKLIVAQRAFQANTKIITTADELLDELNRI